jgi:flagellar motor switch/type III secretory pathway protein FliN
VTQTLQDWLPAEAVERGAVRAAVEPVVAEWAAHWFARGEARLLDWALAADGPPLFDANWRSCGAGLEASCSTRAAVRLAGLALDTRADGLDLADRDRLLLAALARQIVDDLAGRLRRRLVRDAAPPELPAGTRRLIAAFGDGGDVLFSLAIPVPLLLGLCRGTLPKAPPAARIENARMAALGRSTVRLEATLGTATLSLEEARGLAVGDVLLLDRTLADLADLTLTHAPGVVARGALTETEGRLALVLQTAS